MSKHGYLKTSQICHAQVGARKSSMGSLPQQPGERALGRLTRCGPLLYSRQAQEVRRHRGVNLLRGVETRGSFSNDYPPSTHCHGRRRPDNEGVCLQRPVVVVIDSRRGLVKQIQQHVGRARRAGFTPATHELLVRHDLGNVERVRANLGGLAA